MKRIFDLDQSSSHSAKLRINYRCDFLRRGGSYPRIAFEEMLQDRFITVYSTTSPQDSGLFAYLLPIFQAATGLDEARGRFIDRPGRREAASAP